MQKLNREMSNLRAEVKRGKTKPKTSKPKMKQKMSARPSYGRQSIANAPSTVVAVQRSGLPMSNAAIKYCDVIMDPVGSTCTEVGIPRNMPTFTQKVKLFKYFTFTANTDGVAYVALTPNMRNNNSCMVEHSSSTLAAGTSSIVRNGFTRTGVAGIALPLPYDISISNDGFSNFDYSIVAVGVEVEPIGPVLERGGTFLSYASETNEDLSNKTFAAIGGHRAAKFSVITSDRCVGQVVAFARLPDQQNLHDGVKPPSGYLTGRPYSHALVENSYYDFVSGATTGASVPAVLIIQGAKSGASFQAKLVAYVEYSGIGVGHIATPCAPDITGMGYAHAIEHHSSMIHASHTIAAGRHHSGPSAVSTVAVGAGAVLGRDMAQSEDPRMRAAGETLVAVNSIIPRRIQAQALDEIGHGISSIFRRHKH